MKRINLILSSACLVLLLLAAGCKEDLPESANVEPGKESLSFTTDAGSHTVKIETSHSWTATSSESWLTISPDKGGSGQSELTLKAVSNATASAREATVTIQVGHKISTIRISQAQQDVLDLNKSSETVSWLAGSARLTVSANVSDYKVVSDASWLRESPLRSVSDSTLVFVYDENPAYEPRTAKVSIRKDALNSLFTVTQGGRGALYFVLERAEVPASDTQYALKLMKNTPSNGLKLISGSDWVSLSGTRTRAVPQEETVPLTLQPNKITTPREALVVISDESTGKLLTDTFTLVQLGVEHLLHPEQIAYSATAKGETLTIPVQSSGLFEVILPSEASAWLTGSNGIQLAGSLSFTVSENKKPEVRTASITLRLQDNPDMEVAITITQAAADVPATDRLPRMYNLRSLSTVIETEPVNLGAFKATVEYDESDNSNWLTDIHTQGGKLHFQVGDNSASTKRSARLRITPEEGSAVSIRVNQSSTEETYIELEKPGTLASFIDGFHMGDYKNVRLHSANGLNADDLNTLRSTSLGVEKADLTGVTMTTLPAGAFKGSRTIQTVKLPETLTRIGANAFENCSVLEELPVPAGVKEIGARAFAGAFTGSSLSDLDLSGITALVSIDSAAFEGCNTLISLKLPNNLVTIGSHAFNECYSLTGRLVGNTTGSLVFPATLTTIGREAFYNCKNLSGTLTLESAITSIGARAFMKCASLELLAFKTSKLSVIEAETFKECRGLSGGSSPSVILIPSGVTRIARGAFEDTGMSTVDLPATLLEIGRRAFYNCSQISVVICRKSGTPPSLDVDSPEETFGGVTKPVDRTLKVSSADQHTYKANIPWKKATSDTGWTIESIESKEDVNL